MRWCVWIIGLAFLSGVCIGSEMYRAPSPGDSGKYFVLSVEKGEEGLFHVLSSRIGKGNAYTDFTKLKVNCDTKKYFTMAGSSEDGAKDHPSRPLKDLSKRSKWTSVVPGSSKADLVSFVCGNYR